MCIITKGGRRVTTTTIGQLPVGTWFRLYDCHIWVYQVTSVTRFRGKSKFSDEFTAGYHIENHSNTKVIIIDEPR